MKYIIAILIGYLLGSVNMAYICGRIKGFDIRTRGTMSAGASNAKVTMGWPYFFLVLAYDSTKALLAITIVRKLFPGAEDAAIIAGCAAVLGHIFPFYMQFHGGKGYAAYLGMFLAINWKVCLIVTAISLVVAFATNWIVSSTLVVILFAPVYVGLTIEKPLVAVIALAIATLTIIAKHLVNFKRLAKHQEIGINGYYVGTKTKADSK